jgi:hypothetical protein
MKIYAVDYNRSTPKSYNIIINSGQISVNSAVVYDDLDQEVCNIKSLCFGFNCVLESCVVTVVYNNNDVQTLIAIGIING